MLKLVAALALVGALAAGVFLVPIRGRTLADRWNAASGPASFAKNAWDEASRAMSGDHRRDVPAPSRLPDTRSARGGAPARRGAASSAGTHDDHARSGPVEHHSAEDRAALDRLLSQRSR